MKIAVQSAMTSCGYGVPRMELVKPRDTLENYWIKKGPGAAEKYWATHNVRSIDGLETGAFNNTHETTPFEPPPGIIPPNHQKITAFIGRPSLRVLEREPDFDAAETGARIESLEIALDYRSVGGAAVMLRKPVVENRRIGRAYRRDMLAMRKHGVVLRRDPQLDHIARNC